MRRLASILGLLLALAPATRALALDILLTNDDGYQAIGIDIMRKALESAGHRVYVVAPATDQSGKGMSFTTSALLDVIYWGGASRATSVSGTPVDAVRVGLWLYNDAFKKAPDLVVSGINFGANTGTLANSSGTVGAATWAMMQGIPAIAVSAANDPSESPPKPPPYPLTAAIMASAAKTTVAVIASLQQTQQGTQLMAPYTGLNINFPAMVTPNGVVMSQLGLFNSAALTVRPVPNPALPNGMTFSISLAATPQLPFNPRWDTDLLAKGYATIAPINGDWTATEDQRGSLGRRLGTIAQPEGSLP
ncbi:MAG: 5'/3'-nucleotidase SurE [Burkholderiales bacterium]